MLDYRVTRDAANVFMPNLRNINSKVLLMLLLDVSSMIPHSPEAPITEGVIGEYMFRVLKLF